MSAATSIDLSRELGRAYRPGRTPEEITLPPMTALMCDGAGNPNGSPEYSAAISALYSLAYSARFARKAEGLSVFKVMPLETLWNVPADGAASTDAQPWTWTALIVVPEVVDEALVDRVREKAAARAGEEAVRRVRLGRLDEGRCLQVMHVGPWSQEAPTIEALHAAIAERGLRPRLAHHEIYLSDPRRTAPEKLRTIIRQPVEPVEPA